MKLKRLSNVVIAVFMLGISNSSFGGETFYAYHTKVSHTSTDYYGKYADLIVVLGEGRQLEFTRRTQYLPRWVTSKGSFMVDDFHPERDMDHNLYYNYVRLMEAGPEKIVVHWRYIPDIELIDRANADLNPTHIEGFTSVVHELFTITPDGKVEREVKDARGSRYETWIKEAYGDRQTLQLTDDGVKHGPVTWGDKAKTFAPPVEKNPIIDTKGLTEPVLVWTFDEGTVDPEDIEEIEDYEMDEFVDMVYESRTEELSLISGHMSVYKKGVSGTSLGFDGYYTGISFEEDVPSLNKSLSLEAWIALDVYPFNEAPIIHKSTGFGKKGFYLGVDAYGKLFFRVNGAVVKSSKTLPLYTWTHATAILSRGSASLYLDGNLAGKIRFKNPIDNADVPYTIGLNTEKERCTDSVRGHDQNILFIYGLQGMLDEVRVYDTALSEKQVKKHFHTFLPEDRTSPLQKGVLPGELGPADSFGAKYKNLEYHELWDRMWRLSDGTDIVVKFEHTPASVVYWRGTNFAANWVTDNNHWMADQSSEIFNKHGCSEHMSDKQTRHSFARIIENNDARVKIHWRYPCVDVGYVCIDRKNYTDEYHTIYPDGTGIRKVVYNNTTTEAPGFQDIQYFTNPGETALDVVELNAVTVGNIHGEIDEMVWKKPNKNPQTKLRDATIQYMNTKSDWKVYAIYPESGIWTWGSFEQSRYTDDPFAGPWNHWPISIVPSDGRFAVAPDRVTHFALGAGNAGEEAVVHFGFTDENIDTLIPRARSWQNPPSVSNVSGGISIGYSREEKAFLFESADTGKLRFTIEANDRSPLVNPAFVIRNYPFEKMTVKINGRVMPLGKDCRIGQSYDTKGQPKTIIWLNFISENTIQIELII